MHYVTGKLRKRLSERVASLFAEGKDWEYFPDKARYKRVKGPYSMSGRDFQIEIDNITGGDISIKFNNSRLMPFKPTWKAKRIIRKHHKTMMIEGIIPKDLLNEIDSVLYESEFERDLGRISK